jgi:Rod binding domain-containing protein
MGTSDMSIAIEKARNFAVESLPNVDRKQTSPAASAVSALPRGTKTLDASGEQKLNDMAHKLVAQTFFANLLKQMRDSPFKSDLFSGGRGEKAFGPMYDSMLADRMSKGAGEKIVRPIVRKYAKAATAAYQKQKKEGDLVTANRRA